MNSISDLLQGYRAFRDGPYQQQAKLYETLGKGQSPNIMIIGCADSRAEPADIFNAAPGQLFVVRNVANLVPPYEQTEGLHGVSAALEFAVETLKVGHIIVMGHGGCGGVQASLVASEDRPVGQFVGPWVQLLDAARARVIQAGGEDPQTDLELAGIGASINNLMTFPFVRSAVESGALELHGAWFAIALGELHWRDNKTSGFEKV